MKGEMGGGVEGAWMGLKGGVVETVIYRMT
jgi:hypothetical protein